jgi:hypothetical protein
MLEFVVRPFQSPGIITTRRIVPALSTDAPDPANLSWGDAGTLPTGVAEIAANDPTQDGFQILQCAVQYTELSRQTETKRVTNPSDSSQFVDVEIIKSISFNQVPKSQIVGALATETTAFNEAVIPDSEVWGTIKTQDQCQASYTLNNNT